MGWSFSTQDTGRKAYIESLTAARHFAPGYLPLEHRVVGNHVWQLVQDPDGRKFITLDLIAKERNGGWGNKSMSESAGPYYYDCPMALLNKADPPHEGSYAIEWRKKVRAHHAAKKAAKPVAGMVVQSYNSSYTLVRPAGPRLGWVARNKDGLLLRIPATQLARALKIQP